LLDKSNVQTTYFSLFLLGATFRDNFNPYVPSMYLSFYIKVLKSALRIIVLYTSPESNKLKVFKGKLSVFYFRELQCTHG
jgi:hypothetical protein